MKRMRWPLRLSGGLLPLAVAALFVTPFLVRADVREGRESITIAVTTNGVRELPPEQETRLRVFLEEERPSHRIVLPSCQPTRDDTVETYALAGWHLPAGGLVYELNLRRAPEALRASAGRVLEQAAGAWSAVDPLKQLAFAGESAITRPRYDGHHVVLWKLLPRRFIAAAYIWYDPRTGEVLDADMVFNTRVPWALNEPTAGECGGTEGAYDLRAVATHEFGHWLGLDDLSDPPDVDLTMYGFVTVRELKKATLGAGDIRGVAAVAP